MDDGYRDGDDCGDDDKRLVVLDLDDADAAIILRADGSIETFMPDDEEDEDDDFAPGSPGMVAAVLMYLLSDENRYLALEQEFLEMCSALPTPTPEILH